MYRLPERRCQVCGKQFYTEEKHIRHMNRFHPDLWAEFSGGRPLEFFIPAREVQHREKKFVCTVCSKTYSHETGLLKHLVTHPESHELRTRLWSCVVCDKVFTKESYLERHLEMKLDPEHGKALSEYKKRNGIKEVGRVNLNMLLPATSSALVSSSDAVVGKEVGGAGGSGTNSTDQQPSTSTEVMAASSTARTPPHGLNSPPPQPPVSSAGLAPQHHSDLSMGLGVGPPPRSPVLHGPPTPSCSLAAADSTVPSPFSPPPPTTSTMMQSFSSSGPLQRTPPTLTRPLSHPSPLLNRSFSESCLSSPHPLFGPAMSQATHVAAMDAVTHALHGPMSPPPQGCPPHFRSHLGGYNPPVSAPHYGGHLGTNPANLHNTNLPPLRFSHLPFRRDYGPPRPTDQEDVVSALQSLADSIHPS